MFDPVVYVIVCYVAVTGWVGVKLYLFFCKAHSISMSKIHLQKSCKICNQIICNKYVCNMYVNYKWT